MEQMIKIPSFTFTAPFNVEVVEIKGQQRVFLEGIISSTHIDLVGDLVTKNCLESMKTQIIEKNLKLDLEHESFRGDSEEETELNKTKIPVGRMFDADVKAIEKNHFGLFVKSELNPFNERFDNLKGNVEGGFLDAYSIAFIPSKTITKFIEGKEIRLLDDVTLLNVALTGNPINTHALNKEIFMKSIKSLDDYKKERKSNPEISKQLEVKSHTHESDTKLNLKEVKKMSKEDNKETSENEQVTTETESKPESEPEVESKKKKDPKKEDDEEEDKKKVSKKDEIEEKSEIQKLKEEISEIKSILNKPLLKSKIGQQDKSKNFEEEKSLNPLDIIA